jgi:hypothetical protein
MVSVLFLARKARHSQQRAGDWPESNLGLGLTRLARHHNTKISITTVKQYCPLLLLKLPVICLNCRSFAYTYDVLL